MATFLITGGAGFLGSHLTEALLARQHRVLVIDNLSTGSLRNLGEVLSNPRLEVVEAGLADTAVLHRCVARVDVVYHLAAQVGVYRVMADPRGTLIENIFSTETLLRIVAGAGCRVILASTSEVYGKSSAVPFREDSDLTFGPATSPRWSYAVSKFVDEHLAMAYWRESQVPVVIIRPFNVIGPRQASEYGMVVPRFLKQALRREPLTVFGDGTQTRSFVDVSDVVQWLLLLAENDAAVGQVFNLGNPKEITVKELARRVLEITGSDGGIRLVPYSFAYGQGYEDLTRRVPDIRSIVALTAYEPAVDLDASLRRTWEWLLSIEQPVTQRAEAGA